jgi:hypothetical protein
LQPTDERRRTGSHYTPRDLTHPIVLHALEPTFERLGVDATPEQVLEIKLCDPAMGSGAFLVEACRQLAARLVTAWARHQGTRPVIAPDEDEDLLARRLVAQRCLYGVDKNPLATDLAKLSLWLATLARDHEFTFLDHALKSGDSLVGLTLRQIGRLAWKDGQSDVSPFEGFVRERAKEAVRARAEIQNAPDDVERAIQEQRNRHVEARLDQARQIGDAVLAAFFSAQKPKQREDARKRLGVWVSGRPENYWPKLAETAAFLTQPPHPIHPFHWEIEFPEVFGRDNPGFDAIVGNPPFLGGKRISTVYGETYNEWLVTLHDGASRNADLVAHFFRRAFGLIRQAGAFGLIATNTIGQGATRESGLAPILGMAGSVLHAVSRLPWPGEAAVVVSVVHVAKGAAASSVLNGRQVHRISAYLVEGDLDASPGILAENHGRAFIGSLLRGMGFTFDDAGKAGVVTPLAEMKRLIAANPRNAERIKPYIGGEEVNNDPHHAHRRYVIDFTGMTDAEARDGWPDLMAIVQRKVKPERLLVKNERVQRLWWRWEYEGAELYAAIDGLERVLAISRVSPQYSVAALPTGGVYSEQLVVFPFSAFAPLAALQTRVHELWARFFASSMKDDLRYTPTDCFETFPFCDGFDIDPTLETAGHAYHDYRAALMIARNEGLTKTYNRFHDPAESRPDIARLRALHTEMDHAVLAAYGWHDLIPQVQAQFLDPEIEDDPKYHNRYFWPAAVRDEVLARLLALNTKRAAAERARGVIPRLDHLHTETADEPEEIT